MSAARECSRIEWWTWIRDADLPSQAKLVAYALATFMDPDGGRCYPGQERIATACGWSSGRSVRTWLVWLEDNDLLWIVRHGGVRAKGRAQATHRYVPILPADQPEQPFRQEGDDQPERNDDQPERNDDQPEQPFRGPSQSLPHQLEPHQVGMGSPDGDQDQEPTHHPDYIAFCETAHRTFGDTLWTKVQTDSEANKVKFRTAVMEQVEAGADPRLLAKLVCKQDVRDADSIVSLLAWRVKKAGPDVVRQSKARAGVSKLLGVAPFEAMDRDRQGGVTIHD